MIRRSSVIAVVLALIGPASGARAAEGAAEQLAPRLTQAAQSGDVSAFLALTTADTRRAMANAAAAQSRLVATQANQCVSDAHPNNGFIVSGPILNFGNSLPSDNNGQVSWYSALQLQVTYNPAMNPRAPQ